MEKVVLQAEKRKIIGKHVKTLRREGKVPAIIYGSDVGSLPITLDMRETTNVLNKVSSSALLTINVEGDEHATLVREIQQDYLKGTLIHVDFMAVSMKEKLRTNVSISLVGDAPVLEEYSAMIMSGVDTIEVECLPQDLPEVIEVDISHLEELGQAIYVKDIPSITDVDFLTDPEELVAVASAIKEQVLETEGEEEELLEEAEGLSEPEVIEQGKKDEEEDFEE
jgi:large subunit ribosomal protein L25